MSSQPTTPVKVPSTAASYTPATLDGDLRSQINSVLLRDDHIAKIQESLLHSLNSNDADWPTMVQAHALSLLRSGEITTFPRLLRRVLDDVREDTAAAAKLANGTTEVNGKKPNGEASKTRQGLALPQAVVEEALKITRESLEAVCEIEENGAA